MVGLVQFLTYPAKPLQTYILFRLLCFLVTSLNTVVNHYLIMLIYILIKVFKKESNRASNTSIDPLLLLFEPVVSTHAQLVLMTVLPFLFKIFF